MESKYAIMHYTADYRGDHATDICRIVNPVPEETIDQLIDRVKLGQNNAGAKGDYIAIRLMEIDAPGGE